MCPWRNSGVTQGYFRDAGLTPGPESDPPELLQRRAVVLDEILAHLLVLGHRHDVPLGHHCPVGSRGAWKAGPERQRRHGEESVP